MSQTEPKKVLLVWICRLGDLIVSVPFMEALRRRFPHAEITLLTRDYVREMAEMIPWLDRVAVLPVLKNPASFAGFLSFFASRYDLCVDLNSAYSRTAGFFVRCSGAPSRVSFDKFRAKWFYTDTVAAPKEDEHMLERYHRLAGYFGADCGTKINIKIPEYATAQAESIVLELALKPGTKLVAVHPGNFKKYDHRWPEEKFIELTRKIMSDGGYEIVYMSGPGEEEKVLDIIARLPAGIKFLKPMSVAVTAAFLKRVDALVVSATGTMHLAAAVGAPMLSFHSSYTYACWKPIYDGSTAISSGEWNSCRSISVESAYKFFKSLVSGKQPV